MAISLEQIKSVLTRNAKNYWFSRNLEGDIYENVSSDNVKAGDVIWFNSDATIEDLEDAKKSLSSFKMHMYTKTMDENLGGIRVVRAFSAEEFEMQKYKKVSYEALDL